MYNYHLADLDELILKCRDENVRLLVREAVACYRAGAYRACIIISWLALVRDYTIKIKTLKEEILNRNDNTTYTNRVQQYHDLYTRAQEETGNNYSHSLNYENEVPKALKDLGYINKNQMEELQNIKKSRNACAHPYLAGSATEEYTPSAEQARYYLRIIVDYCLSVDPLHGQFLIDKITEIVQRSDFPLDDQRSIKVLREFFSRVNTPTMPKLITHILAKFKEEVLEASPSRWLICLKSLKQCNEAEFKNHFRDCFDNAELYQSTHGYILLMNYLQLDRNEISEKDIAYLEDQFERWKPEDFKKLFDNISDPFIDNIINKFSVLENRIMEFDVDEFKMSLSYFSEEKQKKLCIRFLKENSNSVSVLDRLAKLVNIITFDDFLEISDIIKDNENNFFARPTRQFLQTFRSDSPIDENEKNDLLKQEHLIRISTGKFDDDIPF
ncbi:hypothetical protein VZO05_14565 [Aggregatilineales bacterium SYSU G02658]